MWMWSRDVPSLTRVFDVWWRGRISVYTFKPAHPRVRKKTSKPSLPRLTPRRKVRFVAFSHNAVTSCRSPMGRTSSYLHSVLWFYGLAFVGFEETMTVPLFTTVKVRTFLFLFNHLILQNIWEDTLTLILKMLTMTVALIPAAKVCKCTLNLRLHLKKDVVSEYLLQENRAVKFSQATYVRLYAEVSQ